MHEETNSEVRNTLLFAGGIALVAMGAGMILANPGIRRVVLASLTPVVPELKGPMAANLGGLVPDVERYMKIRGM
jgi:hypothetical protein